MKNQAFSYFAVAGDDGYPRACQAIPGFEPKGAVSISKEDADLISAGMRMRERPVNVEEPATEAPHMIVALAESDKQQVHNIIAAIVEETTVDHREEIVALNAKVMRKFAEYDAVFEAIRNEAGKFKNDGGSP